ncbi:MAG TPA: O-antigen ligase family protein [Candidatus Brocadiaceae bacterium]
MSFVLFTGLLLAYSRSGFMVMAIGFVYLLRLKFLNKRVFKFTLVLAVSVLLMMLFTNFWGFVSSWGIMGKLSHRGFEDVGRVTYWTLGVDYILNNPIKIILGAGYGSVESIFGFGTLESLLFDTLVETGVFGLIFLLLFIYKLWEYSKKYSSPFQNNSIFKAVLYGYYLATPGLLIANTVGGNSIQTDFMAPTFYLSLGICLAHTRGIHVNRKSVSTIE